MYYFMKLAQMYGKDNDFYKKMSILLERESLVFFNFSRSSTFIVYLKPFHCNEIRANRTLYGGRNVILPLLFSFQRQRKNKGWRVGGRGIFTACPVGIWAEVAAVAELKRGKGEGEMFFLIPFITLDITNPIHTHHQA